jgi:superfamily II DNA helicase RecQ
MSQLWEALRECRRQLAEEQGIPPYVVFHDKHAAADLRAAPASVEAFAGDFRRGGPQVREVRARLSWR